MSNAARIRLADAVAVGLPIQQGFPWLYRFCAPFDTIDYGADLVEIVRSGNTGTLEHLGAADLSDAGWTTTYPLGAAMRVKRAGVYYVQWQLALYGRHPSGVQSPTPNMSLPPNPSGWDPATGAAGYQTPPNGYSGPPVFHRSELVPTSWAAVPGGSNEVAPPADDRGVGWGIGFPVWSGASVASIPEGGEISLFHTVHMEWPDWYDNIVDPTFDASVLGGDPTNQRVSFLTIALLDALPSGAVLPPVVVAGGVTSGVRDGRGTVAGRQRSGAPVVPMPPTDVGINT